jgi:hypothetical protein
VNYLLCISMFLSQISAPGRSVIVRILQMLMQCLLLCMIECPLMPKSFIFHVKTPRFATVCAPKSVFQLSYGLSDIVGMGCISKIPPKYINFSDIQPSIYRVSRYIHQKKRYTCAIGRSKAISETSPLPAKQQSTHRESPPNANYPPAPGQLLYLGHLPDFEPIIYPRHGFRFTIHEICYVVKGLPESYLESTDATRPACTRPLDCRSS